MAKTLFNANTIVTPSYFNSLQNIIFVKNPKSDGEYDLLKEYQACPGVFSSRYVPVNSRGAFVTVPKRLQEGATVEGGNFARLADLTTNLETRVTNFSSDGTLNVVQNGRSVQVNSTGKDSVVELGKGLVVVKGSSPAPVNLGLSLLNMAYPVSFKNVPKILSVNLNYLGWVNHLVDLNSSTMSVVVHRSGAHSGADLCQYLLLGEV